ncbi:MAG TPA: CHRD domain-containing protein [Gammaproteobacteria bacterium]|nr:CHRD domain-containing protein [Gammaproteobacteria bacterium]
MKKPLVLLGSVALACSSLGAWAQQTQTPPGQTPVVGQLAPVPGTGNTITSVNAAIADQVFVANLSGFSEIPPRQTEATGAVAVSLNPDGQSLHYRLSVSNLQDVTAAHLHLGRTDENGPVVVPLLGEGAPGGAATPPTGMANGVIAEGDISAASLTGPLANTPLVVLVELMRSGAIYANVHTTQFPEGEIRGQLQGLGADAAAICDLLQESSGGSQGGGGATPGGTTGGMTEGTAGGTAGGTSGATATTPSAG